MENGEGIRLFFWIGTAIMIFLAFGVVLMITIYRSKIYKLSKRESDNLHKASLEAEKKERKRIASDLHDCINGNLGAMQNYVGMLSRKEPDELKKSIFLKMEDTLGETLESIENISFNLMPPMLENMGLVTTLKNYFVKVRKWNNVSIQSYFYSDNINIPASESYEIYRIIQEFITNMINHGKSDNIAINFRETNNGVILEISDNGLSFDFNKCIKNSYGMGLKNISSRIRQINAKFSQVPVDKGNKFIIELNTPK